MLIVIVQVILNFPPFLHFSQLFFIVDKINGVVIGLWIGQFSPSIDEDAMLRTLKLLTEDEAPYWPTLKEISVLQHAGIAPEFWMRRKLINKSAQSFAPLKSFTAHLRDLRGEDLSLGISNQEV